ncbi:hypothetical protein GCM10009725_12680 [Aeromicrobium tamlense]
MKSGLALVSTQDVPQHNDSPDYPATPPLVKTGRPNVTLLSRSVSGDTRLEWVAHPRDRYFSDVTGDPHRDRQADADHS